MTEEATEAGRRPIWQTTQCPGWCTVKHHDADGVDARECVSDPDAIPLTTEETILIRTEPDIEAALDTLNVELEQKFREAAPRITFYRGDGHGFGLTLEEAAQLVETVQRLRSEATAGQDRS